RRRNKDEGPELSKAPSGAPVDLPELPEPDDTPWRVPREQVDGVVDRVFAEYRPVAFFADPGSGFDESDG
ncbi:hypothetical protein KBZ21_54430, partial [Streptomyces sp. A73]|nr:hypothetical protein [Streptomyces sp. A73]